MPILEGFNPFTWDQRVNYILENKPLPLFDLEPIEVKMGVILLITDEIGDIHLYVNGRKKNIGAGFKYYEIDFLKSRIEEYDRMLRKTYKVVKIDAFLPFWLLKRLYLPDYWKPYKKSRKKQII